MRSCASCNDWNANHSYCPKTDAPTPKDGFLDLDESPLECWTQKRFGFNQIFVAGAMCAIVTPWVWCIMSVMDVALGWF